MNEKQYKTVGNAGITSLVLGIVVITSAIAVGVLMIIQGAKLLKSNKDILI